MGKFVLKIEANLMILNIGLLIDIMNPSVT